MIKNIVITSFVVCAIMSLAIGVANHWHNSSPEMDSEFVKITVYNPVPSQTWGNHLETANGTIINPDSLFRSIAISRDLEHRFKLGDSVTIDCNCPYKGNYIINDKLGPKARKQIDVLSHESKGRWSGKITLIKVKR